MSEIVDTHEGSFRRVTDGKIHWWLWECPQCHERQPFDLDHAETVPCSKCGHVGHDLGAALVHHMQARRIIGDSPTHDEGQPHRMLGNGVDGR